MKHNERPTNEFIAFVKPQTCSGSIVHISDQFVQFKIQPSTLFVAVCAAIVVVHISFVHTLSHCVPCIERTRTIRRFYKCICLIFNYNNINFKLHHCGLLFVQMCNYVWKRVDAVVTPISSRAQNVEFFFLSRPGITRTDDTVSTEKKWDTQIETTKSSQSRIRTHHSLVSREYIE